MNFKINSYQLNEHRNELVLYVGNEIFCTICCKDKANKITDNEIEDVISDIEWEQNFNMTKTCQKPLGKNLPKIPLGQKSFV